MIEVSQLTKEFGARRVVDAVDLKIAAGEVFGLLGPNGAGKTTTMRMLIGLVPPSFGRARIGANDASTHSHEIKQITGFVPDVPRLFQNMTGAEYLDMCAELRGLDPASIESYTGELLDKTRLTAEVHRPMSGYSLGVTKKISLVAALAFRPSVLLLDEPTAGLDPGAMRALEDIVRDVAASGTTVLVSTHQVSWVRAVSTRIGIMHSGRLLVSLVPEQLDELMRGADPTGTGAGPALTDAWRLLFEDQGG